MQAAWNRAEQIIQVMRRMSFEGAERSYLDVNSSSHRICKVEAQLCHLVDLKLQ